VIAARDRRHVKRRFGRPTRATQGQAVSFSLPLQGVVCPEGLVGAPDAQACGLHRTQFSPPHSLHRPPSPGGTGGVSFAAAPSRRHHLEASRPTPHHAIPTRSASSFPIASRASRSHRPLSHRSWAAQSRADKRARLPRCRLLSVANPAAGVLSSLGRPALSRSSVPRAAAWPSTWRPGRSATGWSTLQGSVRTGELRHAARSP